MLGIHIFDECFINFVKNLGIGYIFTVREVGYPVMRVGSALCHEKLCHEKWILP